LRAQIVRRIGAAVTDRFHFRSRRGNVGGAHAKARSSGWRIDRGATGAARNPESMKVFDQGSSKLRFQDTLNEH
jgi:hypothetical protein